MGLSASSAKVTGLALERSLEAQKKGKVFSIERSPLPAFILPKEKDESFFIIFLISDLGYYAPQLEVEVCGISSRS